MNALCTLVEQEMFSSPGEKCQRNVTDLAGSLVTSSRPPGRPQKMRRCRGKNSWWQPADRRCWRRAMSELYKNGWTDQDAVGGRFAWTRETTRYTAVKVAPIEWVILWGFAWDKIQKWGVQLQRRVRTLAIFVVKFFAIWRRMSVSFPSASPFTSYSFFAAHEAFIPSSATEALTEIHHICTTPESRVCLSAFCGNAITELSCRPGNVQQFG